MNLTYCQLPQLALSSTPPAFHLIESSSALRTSVPRGSASSCLSLIPCRGSHRLPGTLSRLRLTRK
eukprot:746560-Hanusia_phi.AAC.7